MAVTFFAASDPGMHRANNEDSLCVRPDLGLFVVADGLGGHEAGEVASQAAVSAIQDAVAQTAGFTEESTWPCAYRPELSVDCNRLSWAFRLANDRVRKAIAEGKGREGMATTVVAVLLEGDPEKDLPRRKATIAHIGDSRIYLFRGDRLRRLTRDHSWVQDEVRAGRMSDGEARLHPRRNVLTRALNGLSEARPDINWLWLGAGDQMLLCSDGLYGVVSEEEMTGLLLSGDGVEVGDRTPTAERDPSTRERDPDKTAAYVVTATSVCNKLIRAANAGGGPDNITAVVIRV